MDLLEESNAEHSYVSESQETETQGTRGSRTDWPDKVWAAELRKWFSPKNENQTGTIKDIILISTSI